MPRTTAAPRATLQTSASAPRTGQKPISSRLMSTSARSAIFTDSPKPSSQSAAAAAAAPNPLDAVPDSPTAVSQVSSTASSGSGHQGPRGKRSKKDISPEQPEVHESESVLEVPQEMTQMLQTFTYDIAKSMKAKKRKLEQVTTSSLTSGSRKFDEVWKAQQVNRQKAAEDFRKQILLIFQQWETDVEKTRENEEKLQNQLRQQQKVFSQVRVVQAQRLKSLKDLFDMHLKEVEEMDKAHEEQQASLMVDMKKEMAAMQKKILVDCQQQEMSNLRKSLNAMFSN